MDPRDDHHVLVLHTKLLPTIYIRTVTFLGLVHLIYSRLTWLFNPFCSAQTANELEIFFYTVMTSQGPAFQECTGSLPWGWFCPKGGIIRSAIARWSDCSGQDRDSHHLGKTINHHKTLHAQNETHWPTAACRCHFRGMYRVGKVDISQHLAIPGFSPSDHTLGKPSLDAGSLCSEA